MATQLFLRDAASDLGGAGQKALSLSRGASSTTAITTTTVSGTNIQVTQTAGGQALTWFSDKLPAQTLSGTVTVNIRGRESATTVNAGAGILIEKTNSTGTVQSTILADATIPTTITEYTTTDAAKTQASLAITTTTINQDDRIKITLKVRNVGTMAAGTVTKTYDGPTASAAGDTYVTFSALAVTQTGAAALTAQSNLTVTFPMDPPTEPDSVSITEVGGAAVFPNLVTQAEDWIVVQAGVESNDGTSGMTPTAPGLIFTLKNDSGTSPINRSRVFQWTAFDSAGGTRSITMTPGGTLRYSARATIIRGSEGPGAAANSSTAQTVSLSRLSDHSAVLMNVNDWSTGAVGSPVWTPGGTTIQSQQGSNATYIFGRWDDAGTAGTASHGISSPSYTTPAVAVLEMFGKTSAGTPTVTGDAALTAQSSLTVSATVTELPTVSLTAQSTLVSGSLVTNLPSSALTSQSTLTVAGIVTKLGASALSGQSTLTVAGIIVKLGTATLSSDSTLTASGTVTSSGSGGANLSADSTLTVSAFLTKFGASTLSSDSTLTASAVLTRQGAAGLSGQSTLTVAGLVIRFGAASLTAQSTLSTAASNSVLGAVSFNSQSTMIVDGTIGALPIRADLSALSTLNATAILGKLGTATLSSDSNLTVSARQGFFGSVALTAQSSLNVTGVVTRFGASNLSGQSTLAVAGFVPAIVTGSVAMSTIATLIADAQANPPWVYKLIEFGSVITVSREGGSPETSSFEGDSSPMTFIEGG